MKITFSHRAFRQLSSLDKRIQRRIIEKLDFYISQKDPLKFAERMSSPEFGEFRFRIGDYRIIFDVIKDQIMILRVGHRKDVYK